jgi:hypothetical protein
MRLSSASRPCLPREIHKTEGRTDRSRARRLLTHRPSAAEFSGMTGIADGDDRFLKP